MNKTEKIWISPKAKVDIVQGYSIALSHRNIETPETSAQIVIKKVLLDVDKRIKTHESSWGKKSNLYYRELFWRRINQLWHLWNPSGYESKLWLKKPPKLNHGWVQYLDSQPRPSWTLKRLTQLRIYFANNSCPNTTIDTPNDIADIAFDIERKTGEAMPLEDIYCGMPEETWKRYFTKMSGNFSAMKLVKKFADSRIFTWQEDTFELFEEFCLQNPNVSVELLMFKKFLWKKWSKLQSINFPSDRTRNLRKMLIDNDYMIEENGNLVANIKKDFWFFDILLDYYLLTHHRSHTSQFISALPLALRCQIDEGKRRCFTEKHRETQRKNIIAWKSRSWRVVSMEGNLSLRFEDFAAIYNEITVENFETIIRRADIQVLFEKKYLTHLELRSILHLKLRKQHSLPAIPLKENMDWDYFKRNFWENLISDYKKIMLLFDSKEGEKIDEKDWLSATFIANNGDIISVRVFLKRIVEVFPDAFQSGHTGAKSVLEVVKKTVDYWKSQKNTES